MKLTYDNIRDIEEGMIDLDGVGEFSKRNTHYEHILNLGGIVVLMLSKVSLHYKLHNGFTEEMLDRVVARGQRARLKAIGEKEERMVEFERLLKEIEI